MCLSTLGALPLLTIVTHNLMCEADWLLQWTCQQALLHSQVVMYLPEVLTASRAGRSGQELVVLQDPLAMLRQQCSP